MTFEEEVEKEAVDMCDELGISKGNAQVIAQRIVEERRAWRALSGGAPTQMLDARKYLQNIGVL